MTRLSLVLGCLATFLMMIHVSIDIAARLLTHWRVPGTLETVTFVYMVAVAFLPLAVVQSRRQQIAVELFDHLIPPRAMAFLDSVAGLLGCALMLGLAWYGGIEAWDKTLIRETAPSTQAPVPIWPSRWMVALSLGLVAFHLGVQSVSDFRRVLSGTASKPDLGTDAAKLAGDKPSEFDEEDI